ncbi:rhodanese-like domain-containing protein [Albibacterium indicum]|uniref:rhodanese-like domain-containing protein n=1 Tax=Albibacterium indicum TaxID=2292082 RepID=UPI0019826834|nr:rhodanese-like domain-containing protein [Pedobacter indicus]
MRNTIKNISSMLLAGIIMSGCASLKKSPEKNTSATQVETSTEVSSSTNASTTASTNEVSNVKTVNTDQFSQLLLLDEVQVLDVRTAEEYQSGHIEDAVNIDVQKEDFQEKAAKLDKNRPVLVYCRSGKRSMKAASALESMGFKRIVNLDGGMLAWEEADKPVEK